MEMHWHLPTDLLSKSVTIMRPHGARGHEGLALWFGNTQGNDTQISHLIAVHGPGFKTGPLQLRLSMRAMETLTGLTERLQAHLVGQIHSHPAHMLDLSVADMTYGIRRQDYLSLVCPYYAQTQVASVSECGVHVVHRGSYRRLTQQEIRRRLIVAPSLVMLVNCELPA
jgi:hypothetical protein